MSFYQIGFKFQRSTEVRSGQREISALERALAILLKSDCLTFTLRTGERKPRELAEKQQDHSSRRRYLVQCVRATSKGPSAILHWHFTAS